MLFYAVQVCLLLQKNESNSENKKIPCCLEVIPFNDAGSFLTVR